MRIRTHNGKRVFQRTAAVFLALSILGATLAAGAAAGTGACVTVESAEANAGDTVTVYVKISGNSGISNFDLAAVYDDGLQLTGINQDGLCTKGLFVANPANGFIIWANVSDVKDAEGNLFALTFTVDEDAVPGDYNISVGIKDGGAFGSEDGNAAVDFVDGKITVRGVSTGTSDGGTQSGNTQPGNTQPGNTQSGNTQSGNTLPGNTQSGGTGMASGQAGNRPGESENNTEVSETPDTDVPTVPAVIDFTDVAEGAWYYDCVYSMAAAGVVRGYPDNTFRPQSDVTYAEALKLILLASGYDLADNEEGYWAADYYNFALEAGLVDSGVELDAPIPRIEIAHLLAGANGIAADYGPSPFRDTDDPVAAALYHAGLLKGYGDGNFGPDNMLTRAELTMIVWRLYSYVSTGVVPE